MEIGMRKYRLSLDTRLEFDMFVDTQQFCLSIDGMILPICTTWIKVS